MSRFFHVGKLSELSRPEHVQPFLAKPELHWKKGYSAYELASSWIAADDFPKTVRAVLETCPAYRGAALIQGFFERETDLRTPGRPSQTDLLVLAWLDSGPGIIGVEGKVEESFGPVVSEWNVTPGTERRLEHLCSVLGLSRERANPLRYQLVHRTAAALFEAERYRAKNALMLVHSFSTADASLQDFLAFAEAAGMPVGGKNQISPERRIGDVNLRLGWVADNPSP
jgi:hypothetical protein